MTIDEEKKLLEMLETFDLDGILEAASDGADLSDALLWTTLSQ